MSLLFFDYLKTSRPGKVPALFLHIQKTAGTSIVHLARQYYEARMTSHGDCIGIPPEEFKHIGFISGHIGYNYARHLMQDRFTFTFLRNPAERILSMYYFCRSRSPEEFPVYRMAHEMDLSAFLEAGLKAPLLRERIWNHQVWQLAHGYTCFDERTIDDFGEVELLTLAKQHLAEFTHVGFTETFDADASIIMSRLALPRVSHLPRLNESSNRPKLDSMSIKVKALLDELTALDRQLYEYAWSRREPINA